jgi:hypothetical protein
LWQAGRTRSQEASGADGDGRPPCVPGTGVLRMEESILVTQRLPLPSPEGNGLGGSKQTHAVLTPATRPPRGEN